MKTATITFHASHNYGSMLQAYALQHILKTEIGVENEILNLRTKTQKDLYKKATARPNNFKDYLKKFLNLPYAKSLKVKYQLFEDFLSSNLSLSPEFETEEEIADYAKRFEFLIAGSDQIWNTICTDFDWSYYLPFAKNNAIAYAPSMGPYPDRQISKVNYDKIRKCLKGFKAISVREAETARLLNGIAGIDAEVLVDPTLLVLRNEWESLLGTAEPMKGKYIFLYAPSFSMNICHIASEISYKTGIKVIVSNKLPTKFLFKKKRGRFEQQLATGPIEFLKLLKNAEFVISGSFHAIVFSIIFQKPFLAYRGNEDSRMKQILSSSSLLDYAITGDNYFAKLDLLDKIDFSGSLEYISRERNRSFTFLKNSLGL